MALWGISTSDESKPKYLSQEDKNNCIGKAEGWVLKKTVGSRNLEEVLVAVGSNTNLSSALGAATIDAVFFEASSYAQGDSAKVIVVYNENVDVTGSPTLVVTGSVTGSVTATAANQSNLNKVEFAFTVPSQTETLSIGAQTIGSGSGIVDDVGGAAADLTIAAGNVIDAGGAGTGGTATIAVA